MENPLKSWFGSGDVTAGFLSLSWSADCLLHSSVLQVANDRTLNGDLSMTIAFLGWPELVMIALVGAIIWFGILLNTRILKKAGFSPWLCLLMLIPFVNIVMIWVFAFTTWPAQRDKSDPRTPS